MLRLDVVATPRALARITSIMAARQFNVLSMDATTPADGLRTITVEVATVDEPQLVQLVKYLSRSLDVVKVVRLRDDKSHSRRGALITITLPDGRLAEIVAIASAFSAEIVDVSKTRCTLFVAAEPTRVDALVALLSDFPIREIVTTAPLRVSRSSHQHHVPTYRAETRGQR